MNGVQLYESTDVLILIVMEYLLRVHRLESSCSRQLRVLILIVMEYLLRVPLKNVRLNLFRRLNPYCYGIPSQSSFCSIILLKYQCLNPYCYGIPSQRVVEIVKVSRTSLNPYCYGIPSQSTIGT